jgi:hypothetical protein
VLNRGKPSDEIAVAGLDGKAFSAATGEGEAAGFIRVTQLIANDHHQHKKRKNDADEGFQG